MLDASPDMGQCPPPMNRPDRQTKHLEEKIAQKTAIAKDGLGKKAKRWKKSLEARNAGIPVAAANDPKP